LAGHSSIGHHLLQDYPVKPSIYFVFKNNKTSLNMNQQLLMQLRGVTAEELQFLEQLTNGFNEEQTKNFVLIYGNKRKDPQDILLFTLLGFVIIAGVQRIVLGQIGMGLLYLFTGGLCVIGTIVDLINHKSLTMEYNRKVALDAAQMARILK
jgi:TM2 domain-containing membrane protein YozV